MGSGAAAQACLLCMCMLQSCSLPLLVPSSQWKYRRLQAGNACDSRCSSVSYKGTNFPTFGIKLSTVSSLQAVLQSSSWPQVLLYQRCRMCSIQRVSVIQQFLKTEIHRLLGNIRAWELTKFSKIIQLFLYLSGVWPNGVETLFFLILKQSVHMILAILV